MLSSETLICGLGWLGLDKLKHIGHLSGRLRSQHDPKFQARPSGTLGQVKIKTKESRLMAVELKITSRIYVSLFLLLFLLLSAVAPRQQSAQQELGLVDKRNRANLHQALLDLTNPFTVLCVAAHPDDEDGSTLTVLRRKYGVHTVSLFSTYGEGGQNAVGPELYEDLGVIRARETMAAARIQGSEPYFLGLKDFGYSKSADEAFRIWGHDEALRRMVLKIRELRP